jgi:D-alanyl-D-alanine carboxypeptidase/D-alanyl-D-alanine-endopeptidase (penicillin-binding protein 4)
MSFSLRLSFATLLIFLSAPRAVSRSGSERSPEYNLHQSIDKLFAQKFAKRASTAVKIISAETGEVLYERNSRALLTPASTIKLISSAAALAKLGPTYAFKTDVSTDDTSHPSGTIHGNLYLRGTGDPYLTSADLRDLAEDLRKFGVTEIQGDIVGDESYFDHASTCNGMPGEHYTSVRLSHLSSLSVDTNILRVALTPARKKGAKARVDLSAGASSIKIVNQCVTVAGRVKYRPSVKAVWGDNACTIRVVGSMALGSRPRSYTLRVPSPAWYAAASFREQLLAAGISVGGVAKVGLTPTNAHLVASHENPIEAVLTAMNKESDNFAAEMVFRAVGAETFAPPGSAEKGVAAIEEFLDGAGVPHSAYKIFDGSGVSHQNGVSADAFTMLLRYLYTRKDLFNAYAQTLPAAGIDGTLKGRMAGTSAEGNLRAKTGTLNGVTSLAGYVTNADNEVLIFSITSTDFSAGKKRYRSLQDRIGIILASFSRNRYTRN